MSDESEIHTFAIITLDVWGHGPDEHEKYDCDGECDGYTVNQAFHTNRRIEVPAQRKVYNAGTPREFVSYETSDEAIIKALVDARELDEKALVPGAIDIDGEDDFTLFVNDAKTEEPLLQLARIKD